jgi:cytochrome c biogenesis protein CcdA/glutaredoxin-related protein
MALLAIPANTHADDSTEINGAFFFSPDCPCTNESLEVINQLQTNYTDFEISSYDVDIIENWTLSQNFIDAYNVMQEERTDFPLLFIGDFYFPFEKFTYTGISQILDSYQGQNVSLWPEWGEVRWTTCVVLFYNSTMSEGLAALDIINTLDTTHLNLATYDISGSLYNSSLLPLYLEAYNSSLNTSDAAIFIGDDLLLGENITESNIDTILLKYSGTRTPCKDISEPVDTGSICVVVFYSGRCSECAKAKDFLKEMDTEYPDLNITYYNIHYEDNEVLKHSFAEYYSVPVEQRGVLLVFIGDKYFTDRHDLEEGFEEQVIRYEDGVSCVVVEPDEKIIIDTFNSFTILAVMAAGLIDGVNPCAFATMIFFITYLRTTKRSERQMLLIGISFVLGIFITYLILGMGLISGVEAIDQTGASLIIIYLIAGIVALIFGIYSLYDYFKIRAGKTREMVLKLPKRIKELVHWIIHKQENVKYFTIIALIFAFVTGVLISLFEFVCTGQVYIPTIMYISGKSEYSGQAFLYLVLYCLMFIVPLLLIFIAAYFGVKPKRMKEFLRDHVGFIKIITAVLFFVLAGLMFVIILS